MDKPKKKVLEELVEKSALVTTKEYNHLKSEIAGYNLAVDRLNDWLPKEKEIEEIIREKLIELRNGGGLEFSSAHGLGALAKTYLAKAIVKRLK